MNIVTVRTRVRRFFERTEIVRKKLSESVFYNAFESAVKSMHDAIRKRPINYKQPD